MSKHPFFKKMEKRFIDNVSYKNSIRTKNVICKQSDLVVFRQTQRNDPWYLFFSNNSKILLKNRQIDYFNAFELFSWKVM